MMGKTLANAAAKSKRRRLLPQIQLKNELLSDDNSSGQDQGTSEQQNSDNSCGAEDCLMEQEGDDGCSDLSDAAEEAGKGPLCHGYAFFGNEPLSKKILSMRETWLHQSCRHGMGHCMGMGILWGIVGA
eukprot:1154475-Pelagomonas_calceolata.AAC.3